MTALDTPDPVSTTDSPVAPLLAELDAVVSATVVVREALAALPGLANDWAVGEPDEEQLLAAELITGPDAIADMWTRLASAGSCYVLPDPTALAGLTPCGDAARGIRVVVTASDEEARRAALTESARLGVAVRSLPDPPSWFAVDDADRCCYPSAWRPARPEHLLVLHDPVAAGGFRMLFEELWRRSAPLEVRAPEWEPVLRLLDRGLNESAVAAALHVSERTVRRRIRDASEALGARNRFTLGLAWASSGGVAR